MMILHLLALALGLSLFMRPDWFAQRSSRRHSRRLAELRSGAGEAFFEERRELETYPPVGNVTMLRFFGGVVALGALIAILSA